MTVKRFMKSILIITLACCMMVGNSHISVNAAENKWDSFYIYETADADGDAFIHNNDLKRELPEGVSYEESTSTIILNGVNIECYYLSITAERLLIKGENTIKGRLMISSYESGLTISGDGTLNLDVQEPEYSPYDSISCGKLNLDGVTINLNQNNAFRGIYSDDDININNCNINIDSTNNAYFSVGIDAWGSLDITDSDICFNMKGSGSSCIQLGDAGRIGTEHLTIKNSNIELNAPEGYGIFNGFKSQINYDSSSYYYKGNGKAEYQVSLSDFTKNREHDPGSTWGTYNYISTTDLGFPMKDVTLKKGDIVILGTGSEISKYEVIKANDIKGKGKVSCIKFPNTSTVTVPHKIKDENGCILYVTKIAKNVAKGNKKIKKTIIPEVSEIGSNAFKDCKNLKSVVVKGQSLSKVGNGAFSGIAKNATITIKAYNEEKYKEVVELIKKSKPGTVRYKLKVGFY